MSSAAELVYRASRSLRLSQQNLLIDGVPFDLKRYPFLVDYIDDDHPDIVVLKGAQLGFTIGSVLKCFDRLIHERLRGLIYYFPTDSTLTSFVKGRWNRLQNDNAALAQHVRDTDSMSIKQIGTGMMYFRPVGPRGYDSGNLAQLKSVPADALLYDELDEMSSARVEASLHRLDAAESPSVTRFSTPTFPDYGVDLHFQKSDRMAWFWKCERCNGWTNLEQHWPDCVATHADGGVDYLCMKCREPLVREIGDWVATLPDALVRGYHISQLCSPTIAPETLWEDFEERSANGTLREFYNQRLARPYADVEDALDDATLDACAGDMVRAPRAEGPCAIGVDPGKKFIHYVVAERTGPRTSRVVQWGRCESFDELASLGRRYNVRTGVVDAMAETRAVNQFLDGHSTWYGAQYVAGLRSGYEFSPRNRRVVMNRTEALDRAHHAIASQRVEFPAQDELYREMVRPQFKSLVRVRTKNADTGDVKYQWILRGQKTGERGDHLFHAWAYCMAALEELPVAERIRRSQRGTAAPRKRRPVMAM